MVYIAVDWKTLRISFLFLGYLIHLNLLFTYLHFYIDRQEFLFVSYQQKEAFMSLYLVQQYF